MTEKYEFKRTEIRRVLLTAVSELITEKTIAKAVYEAIMTPLEDFLSDHERNLVHCKDCMHCDVNDKIGISRCCKFEFLNELDDYCSYGAREESEE